MTSKNRLVEHDGFFERFSGMVISGWSTDHSLVEMVELPDHPWYIGCQFHPEFTSRPRGGHPLFTSFIEAALAYAGGGAS